MACFKLMLKTLKRLQQASAHSVINYRKKLTNLRNWFILKNSKERNFTFPVWNTDNECTPSRAPCTPDSY